MRFTSRVLDNVPGIIHGFGTRAEPMPAVFAETWEERRARWQQVHGIAAVEIRARGQACGEADAFYSREPGIPVAVMTADCVPILLARRTGGAVAAVHAGWRGTKGRILRGLWSRLAAEGEKPGDWVAAIGPAIGPCCYEVSPELGADFARDFSDIGGLAVPRERHLDLPAINAAECDAIGLGEVHVIRACTRCLLEDGSPKFHSYRREGGGTRQWSVISIEVPGSHLPKL